MGINDRDYMREDSSSGDSLSPKALLIAAGQMILIGVAVLICLRIGIPVAGRLALVVLVMFLGTRWVLRTARRSMPGSIQKGRELESRKNYSDAMVQYEAAMRQTPKDSGVAVRLLAVYTAAGETGKARKLIRNFEGKLIKIKDVPEFRRLVGDHIDAEFTDCAGGAVMHVKHGPGQVPN